MLLTFDACAEFLLIGTDVVLYLENLLYLALVLNFVFYLAHSMCWIAKNSYIHRLCWTTSFIWHFRCAELQKNSYVWHCSWYASFFGTCDKLHCKSSYIWRLCSTTYFIWHCQCAALQNTSSNLRLCWTASFNWHSHRAACWKPLIFRACVELRLLLALPISSIAKYFLHLTLVLNFF